eukprot:scaffold164407_cov30-Tisochrysis_lutea.AAC.1
MNSYSQGDFVIEAAGGKPTAEFLPGALPLVSMAIVGCQIHAFVSPCRISPPNVHSPSQHEMAVTTINVPVGVGYLSSNLNLGRRNVLAPHTHTGEAATSPRRHVIEGVGQSFRGCLGESVRFLSFVVESLVLFDVHRRGDPADHTSWRSRPGQGTE